MRDKIIVILVVAVAVVAFLWLVISLWNRGVAVTNAESVAVEQPTTSTTKTTTAPAPIATTTIPATTSTTVRARTAPIVVHAASVTEPTDADFDRLAQCESGGRWNLNTGNGYYGGLQFSASTWRSYGGTGLPHEHTREVQIEIGRRAWRARGWAPWPTCRRTARLG